MRSLLTISTLAIAITFTLPATASAGLPSPATVAAGIPCDLNLRSVRTLAPAPAACQYRLRADGSLDALQVLVTLRDCFETPVAQCSVKATLAPSGSTPAFCACEPVDQVAVSNPFGALGFTFKQIGGRGAAEVRLTAYCAGAEGFPPLTFQFTSPDLNGSCQAGSSTTIADLGVFAGGLPPSPYGQASDFDCNGTVNIIDLGLWAGGLGVGCP